MTVTRLRVAGAFLLTVLAGLLTWVMLARSRLLEKQVPVQPPPAAV